MPKYEVCFQTERRVLQSCEYFMEVEAETYEEAISMVKSWEGEITDFSVIDEDVLYEVFAEGQYDVVWREIKEEE